MGLKTNAEDLGTSAQQRPAIVNHVTNACRLTS